MDGWSKRRWRVAVLAGGRSAERSVSLASGVRAAAALATAGHQATLVDPAVITFEELAAANYDICFITLHGGSGEDGRLQRRLAACGIPYTGSASVASARAMSKSAAKRRFVGSGVPTPPWVVLSAEQPLEVLLARTAALEFPLVVKPDGQGSSLGVTPADTPDELVRGVRRAGRLDRVVLAERRIIGRELTVSVLGRRALAPLEIVSCESIFDYHAKYSSARTEYHFDLGLSPKKMKELQTTAVAAAAALGASGLVRVDLMLDRRQCVWVLEVNTVPGLTDHSLAPMAAQRAGIGLAELCDWMLRDGIATRGRRPTADCR